MEKVILILIDGMRPDALVECGNDYVECLKKESSYTFDARSVFPSVTLPCHISLFHSVPPQRHGTLNNTYAVPVRPVDGLFEEIKKRGKKAAMFYSWEQLRDISRPGSLMVSELMNIKDFEGVDTLLTEKALEFIDKKNPDFVFLYLGETDEFGGHKYGWMSDEYLSYINTAMDCVRKVVQSVGNEYTIIVTADHGGHDRTHGTEMNEDMQIPMFFRGKNFEENKELSDVSLLDIVPTVADVMGLDISDDWEGKSICNR